MARRARGLALITTLYVGFVILLFGLTLATLSGFHYQMANDRVRGDRALEAAQAGVAETMYGLSTDPSWGKNGERKSGAVDADTTWSVSFQSSDATYSVNNLDGHARVPGWRGQPVPPWSALVVCEGRCGDQRARVVEAVVQFAAFPYALAASGQVSSANILTVTGVPSLDGLLSVGGLLGTLGLGGSSSSTQTGSVYGGTSVSSSGPAVVTGKVVTPGACSLAPGSVVAGGVVHNSDVLPDLDIQSFNNQGFEGVTELAGGGTYNAVSGPTYVNGDITLSNALLVNAYLFVDHGGRLTSIGGLQGTGSIFVTGDAQLEGSLNVVAGTGIAVFTQGNLQIQGGSWFQGVLYGHGNIAVASGIQVVGGVVAENAVPSAANVTLQQGAAVIQLAEYTQFASSWSRLGMQGSLLNGRTPQMRVMFWREMQ